MLAGTQYTCSVKLPFKQKANFAAYESQSGSAFLTFSAPPGSFATLAEAEEAAAQGAFERYMEEVEIQHITHTALRSHEEHMLRGLCQSRREPEPSFQSMTMQDGKVLVTAILGQKRYRLKEGRTFRTAAEGRQKYEN